MTPERWRQVRAIFDSAVEAPASSVEDLLRERCAGDPDLYSEVRRMLDEHVRSGMLDHPVRAPSAPVGRAFETGLVIAGRYRIVRALGRGGMGEVYEAEDVELGESVALKTLLPEIAADARMIARFKQEIQLSRKIAHPNVCRVFDLARHPAEGPAAETVFFLTMEFLPGETLGARLRREGRIAAADVLPLLEQMAEALDAAHRTGVIHRDFKPSNVMLTESGAGTRAVITDFGLARPAEHSEESTATASGQLIGTLGYMAPELFTGGTPSAASDIYALGLVAYKAVTGELPFESSAPLAAVIRRAGQAAPSARARVPDLDPAWDRALARALDPDPSRRFASGREFVQALRGETASVTVKLPVMTRRRVAGAVVVALVVVAAAIGWRAWERTRSRPGPEAEGLYQKGADDLHAGAYFAATKALGETVRLAPGFALAHARLAEAWVGLDLPEKASEEMLIARRQDLSALSRLEKLQLDAIDLTITREYPAAAAKYEEMLPLAGANASEIAVDLGRAYEKLGKSDKAVASFLRAAKGPGNSPAAWLRLAVQYNRVGDLVKSDDAFQQSEQFYHQTSNLEGLTQVWQERGVAANRRGKFEEGRKYLQQSLDTARVSGNDQQEIATELWLAHAAYQAGDSALAEKYAKGAFEKARAKRLEALAVGGLINLGNAYSRKRDFAAAESYLQEALASARSAKTVKLIAVSLYSLATLHDQTRRYQEASGEAQEALAYYSAGQGDQETFGLLTILGRAQRSQGSYAAAAGTFENLLNTAQKGHNRAQMASAHESLASLAFAQDQYPKALEHYKNAFDLSSGVELTGYAALNWGNLLWRLGRYDDASTAFARVSDSEKQFATLALRVSTARAEMALSQCRYTEAATLARRALAKADLATAGRLRGTICLAELARANRSAWSDCESSSADAMASADMTAQLSGRMIRFQYQIARRDRDGALQTFHEAETGLDRHPESRWRFLVLAAQLDPQYGAAARQALNELSQLWGDEAFHGYLTRPDIALLARPLLRPASANTNTR
jgi:tetratricopeptide (TPR) repeat protein